jgi:hypothetical protein
MGHVSHADPVMGRSVRLSVLTVTAGRPDLGHLDLAWPDPVACL